MDWDDVRYFLALARKGSVRAAGAELGVSHSTVSRRVEGLEERLSTRLFDRNPDGYELTEAGQQMVPGAERVELEFAALQRQLVGQDTRLAGPIRLTCCDAFVSDMMLRDMAAFCQEHPEIELCVTADSRSFDLGRREADIAIRTLAVGDTPPEALIGQCVAPVIVANYVATAHAARIDPEAPGSRPRWIAFENRAHAERMIAETSYPDVPPWGAFNSLDLLVQATREGLGIAMLPCYVADRDPSLRRLAEPDLRHMADLWLLSHPDLRTNARLKASRSVVREALLRREALFRGHATL